MPLKLFKRPGGTVWHYRGTVADKRLRGSCRTEDKTTAEQIIVEIARRHWKGALHGPGTVLTFAQAAALYRGSAKSTRFLDPVEDYWKNTLVSEITAGAIRGSAAALYPGTSPATQNRQVIVPTQAIINHAAELGKCNPVRVKRFTVVKREKQPATWPWVEAFCEHANPHLDALAKFLYLTGARITEALAVKWDDIDLGKRRALIRQGKLGGEERSAHLPDELVLAIAAISPRKSRVFGYAMRKTAVKAWDKCIKRAGIKPLSFHALRHGFASGLLDRGVSPSTVAKRGGWKSTRHVFETYGHDVASDTITDLLIDRPKQAKTVEKLRRIE